MDGTDVCALHMADDRDEQRESSAAARGLAASARVDGGRRARAVLLGDYDPTTGHASLRATRAAVGLLGKNEAAAWLRPHVA